MKPFDALTQKGIEALKDFYQQKKVKGPLNIFKQTCMWSNILHTHNHNHTHVCKYYMGKIVMGVHCN